MPFLAQQSGVRDPESGFRTVTHATSGCSSRTTRVARAQRALRPARRERKPTCPITRHVTKLHAVDPAPSGPAFQAFSPNPPKRRAHLGVAPRAVARTPLAYQANVIIGSPPGLRRPVPLRSGAERVMAACCAKPPWSGPAAAGTLCLRHSGLRPCPSRTARGHGASLPRPDRIGHGSGRSWAGSTERLGRPIALLSGIGSGFAGATRPFVAVRLPFFDVPLPFFDVPLPFFDVPLPFFDVPLPFFDVPLPFFDVPLPFFGVPLPFFDVPLPCSGRATRRRAHTGGPSRQRHHRVRRQAREHPRSPICSPVTSYAMVSGWRSVVGPSGRARCREIRSIASCLRRTGDGRQASAAALAIEHVFIGAAPQQLGDEHPWPALGVFQLF